MPRTLWSRGKLSAALKWSGKILETFLGIGKLQEWTGHLELWCEYYHFGRNFPQAHTEEKRRFWKNGGYRITGRWNRHYWFLCCTCFFLVCEDVDPICGTLLQTAFLFHSGQERSLLWDLSPGAYCFLGRRVEPDPIYYWTGCSGDEPEFLQWLRDHFRVWSILEYSRWYRPPFWSILHG